MNTYSTNFQLDKNADKVKIISRIISITASKQIINKSKDKKYLKYIQNIKKQELY